MHPSSGCKPHGASLCDHKGDQTPFPPVVLHPIALFHWLYCVLWVTESTITVQQCCH
jgi:hypothetical protein